MKFLLDDDRLPPIDELVARIADARRQGRRVAAHCVTAGELAIMLAAFEAAGSIPGDRIEHGGVIPAAAIPELRRLRLTVVTQSGFIHDRGDRYRALVDPAEQDDLYRCASLVAAGVPVAGSSDAPYGRLDCWASIHTAIARTTASGHPLAANERIPARAALGLYLTAPDAPGGPERRVMPGGIADLCLLREPLAAVLSDPHAGQVAATIRGGRIVFSG